MEPYKLFQLGAAYAQSLWAYHTRSAPRPFSASFAVSNKCNIRCSYCNFPNIKHTDLTLEQIETIFIRLKQIGVVRLGILGGEPLFRKDIVSILELGKRLGFSMSMNTNLILYDKFKDDLDAIDYFFTSLDGDEETHIRNRGKNSYKKVLEGIDDILSRGKKITPICVVTEDTKIETLEYLLDLGEKRKIKIHFQPECYDTEYTLRTASPTLKNERLRSLWTFLIQKKKEGAPIFSSMPYLRYISQWDNYENSVINETSETCAAGNTFFFVDATGEAYPCAYTKGKTKGVNMLSDEWRTFFNSPPPCTRCIVGPMLEFNLVSKKPLASIFNALKNI